MIATAAFITHAMAGKWRHIDTSYTLFQPFKGGKRFCFLQAFGWSSFATAIFLGFRLACAQLQRVLYEGQVDIDDRLPPIIGLLGLVGEVFIVSSLFVFKVDKDDPVIEFHGQTWAGSWLLFILEQLFRPKGAMERKITYNS